MAQPIPGASYDKARKDYVRPRTAWGTISLWAFVGFLLVFAATRALVPTGILGEGGATFFSNLAIAIPMSASALLAAAALVLGVASFFKGERSVLVGAAAVTGFGVTAFAVAEMVGSPA